MPLWDCFRNMYSILAITLLLTGLCSSQSLPDLTSPAYVYTPDTCTGCQIGVATATANPNPSTLNAGINSTVVFTAYSITSTYSSDIFCITTSGSATPVSPPYSFTSPASLPASIFISNAGFAFVQYLGLRNCYGGAQTPNVTLTNNNGSATANSTKASISRNSSQTNPPTPNHTPDEQAKIGIGVTVPVVVTALILLALLLWRRSRKTKRRNAPREDHIPPEDSQPYLQRKAELEAEEKRKYELAAEERRYELDGETRIHEILDGNSHGFSPSHTRQELRGEEHSRELEVPLP